ncbi:MAG: hypothetical protein M3Q34_01290 [bacterium]|nr:hypothetical protein [bacterium]
MKKPSINTRNIYIKISKYLPSKKFLVAFGSVIFILVLVFSISYLLKSRNTKTAVNREKNSELRVQDQTVLELLQNDADKDGVFDWEETLWGLNKHKPATFDGVPDLKYIENKKKELNIVDEKDDKALTETDKFAREFFSAYTAMQGSGEIDSKTIQNFATSLGQRIADPKLVDKYTSSDMKISKVDNLDRQENYYTTISDLFAKYEAKGIGEELAIISSGLEAYSQKERPNALNELAGISKAYIDFASDVMSTQAPESLAKYHLRIANGANNTGVSVLNMAKVINDPLVGVSGVSEYEKYSEELVDAVEELEASFDE